VIELPYGRTPYVMTLPGRSISVVEAARRPPARPLGELLESALDHPIGSPPVGELVRPGDRVTVIVSDATRDEPRGAFLAALQERLPPVNWTIAIATGTHGPADVSTLGIPDHLLATARIVNHDGHRATDLVDLGTTSRGTPVRLHRCAVETDLVIATGCIRPHYFAGFGAGVKAIFPGLGETAAIRTNHTLKSAPGSRAGVIDGNPCREDLVEAVDLLPSPRFVLDGVCGPDGAIHAVVAGDLDLAFRAGASWARSWFTVHAPSAPVVIASDMLPVTASLYQAAKIAAAAAPLLEPGGVLVLVAECPDGIGPKVVVNEAVFRIGILPRLPPGARIALVSGLPANEVACTLVEYAASVGDAIRDTPGPVVVVPRASQLILEVTS
jgi:nickel-dependent lactate racemase